MSTTRARLLSAAADLLDKGGPAAVTLREVGARAGVSHNTPYRHFTDKRDLLAAVAAEALRGLTERLDAARSGPGSGAQRLEAAALCYVRWAGEEPARFKLVFGSWEEHPELHDAAQATTRSLRECVDAAVADGSVRDDPGVVASLVWALGHGAVDLQLAGHLPKTAEDPGAEAIVSHLIRLLADRGAPPG